MRKNVIENNISESVLEEEKSSEKEIEAIQDDGEKDVSNIFDDIPHSEENESAENTDKKEENVFEASDEEVERDIQMAIKPKNNEEELSKSEEGDNFPKENDKDAPLTAYYSLKEILETDVPNEKDVTPDEIDNDCVNEYGEMCQ